MYEDIFIGEMPNILKEDELIELFIKYENNDVKAREEIIKHNIRLVLFEINKRFSNVNVSKQDLFQIGVIGLISAVDNFDYHKYKFSTYAIHCIDNEILKFLIKNKKDNYNKEIIEFNNYNSDLNIEEEYLEKEQLIEIRNLVEKLPELEKEIIKLYFGFYGKRYSQDEIAKIFNTSQASISRIILKTLSLLKKELTNELIR